MQPQPDLKGARDKSLREDETGGGEDVTGAGGRGGRIWLRLREFFTIRWATETSRRRAGAVVAGDDDILSDTAGNVGAGGKFISFDVVMSGIVTGVGALASGGGVVPDIVESMLG